MICPGCPPHPAHAGRCPRYSEPAPARLVQCRCRHRQKESHDSLEAFYRGCGDPDCEEHRQPKPWNYPEEGPNVDRPTIPSQPGPGAAERPAGVPGGRVTIAESLKALSALSAALDEPISGGPSMRELLGGDAARLRGEGL